MTVAVVDEVHAAAGSAGDRPLDVLDDVGEIFEILRLAVDTGFEAEAVGGDAQVGARTLGAYAARRS
ncbi:hypothetical protein ABZ851_14985 [Streptomyces sp. NPDC047049]|uniref:hypothetical protein n=1 Tax=Streptomyces sp. NPDC047049 TaxID=3156688 RepID=UPI0033C442D0